MNSNALMNWALGSFKVPPDRFAALAGARFSWSAEAGSAEFILLLVIESAFLMPRAMAGLTNENTGFRRVVTVCGHGLISFLGEYTTGKWKYAVEESEPNTMKCISKPETYE
jgi:hypothetical protein